MTVTPGLPPLLTNESYQCQFTDRDRLKVITVDAEEVTPNTAYQCNITGRIPTFTGVQLGKVYYAASVISRPSLAPVFDRLEYATTEREGLVNLTT